MSDEDDEIQRIVDEAKERFRQIYAAQRVEWETVPEIEEVVMVRADGFPIEAWGEDEINLLIGQRHETYQEVADIFHDRHRGMVARLVRVPCPGSRFSG